MFLPGLEPLGDHGVAPQKDIDQVLLNEGAFNTTIICRHQVAPSIQVLQSFGKRQETREEQPELESLATVSLLLIVMA
jgi:hypothetical protein